MYDDVGKCRPTAGDDVVAMADDSILELCVKKKYFVWPHAESIKDGVVIYSWNYFCLEKNL